MDEFPATWVECQSSIQQKIDAQDGRLYVSEQKIMSEGNVLKLEWNRYFTVSRNVGPVGRFHVEGWLDFLS